MAIDWTSQLNSQNPADFFSDITSGESPITGSGYPHGYMANQPVGFGGGAHCCVEQWILENTPFEVKLQMSFEAWQSTITLIINDSQSGTNIATWGPYQVTGRVQGSSNFADQHARLGQALLLTFAQWCSTVISGG